MRALLDANVLYPATLRSLPIDLSVMGVYRAHWTDEIHDEWIRNLVFKRPDLDPVKLQRNRELMDRALDTARITGYEALIPQVRLPDPEDRHVVAAALQGGMELIVTQNLKDFPEGVLKPLGFTAIHPDRFVGEFLQAQPEEVLEALRRGRARYRAPVLSAEEMLTRLERQGLSTTSQTLRASVAQF